MEQGLDKCITPSGEAAQSLNPPILSRMVEPHSDSGGGSFRPEDATSVEHLASVVSHTTSGSTSSKDGACSDTFGQVGPSLIADSDMSIVSPGTVDSGAETNLPGGTAEDKGSKKPKKELTKEHMSLKRYRNAKGSLRKLLQRKPEDLSEKEKGYIDKNKKIISHYEKWRASLVPETEKDKLEKSSIFPSFSSGENTGQASQKQATREEQLHLDSGGNSSRPEQTASVAHLASVDSYTTSGITTGTSGASSDPFVQGGPGHSADNDKPIILSGVNTGFGDKLNPMHPKQWKKYKRAKWSLKKLLKREAELCDRERVYVVRNRCIIRDFEKRFALRTGTLLGESSKISGPPGTNEYKNTNISEFPSSSTVSPVSSGRNPGQNFQMRASTESSNIENTKVTKNAEISPLDQTPADCVIAIVDQSDPEGKISAERWKMVESRLLYAMATMETNSMEEVSFEGAGWYRGFKIIGCSGQKSVEFLTRVVGDLGELWPGAKLEVKLKSELSTKKVVWMWLPPPIVEDEATMKLISKQNGLDTSNWTIISSNASANGVGKDLVVTVDYVSFAKLKDLKGSIKFGFNVGKLRLPSAPRNSTEGAASGAI